MEQVINYSRTERQMPYTGAPMDDFSKLMYDYVKRANDGFTFCDMDAIIRNHKKQSLTIIEIKTRGANLTYSQKVQFNEMDEFLKRGVCCGWEYIGFFKVVFENTSFEDGKCFVNDNELSKDEFLTFLDVYF